VAKYRDYLTAEYRWEQNRYLSAGPKTCSLRDPNNRTATGWGSYGYEERDAAWIAKQGADYLKVQP
jgi:hypothetical protein